MSGWGRTHVPARPGQHHVHVYVPYFLPSKLGPADATADVRPGQAAELEYKAPMWAFSAGALGVGPQKYNGVGITLALDGDSVHPDVPVLPFLRCLGRDLTNAVPALRVAPRSPIIE